MKREKRALHACFKCFGCVHGGQEVQTQSQSPHPKALSRPKVTQRVLPEAQAFDRTYRGAWAAPVAAQNCGAASNLLEANGALVHRLAGKSPSRRQSTISRQTVVDGVAVFDGAIPMVRGLGFNGGRTAGLDIRREHGQGFPPHGRNVHVRRVTPWMTGSRRVATGWGLGFVRGIATVRGLITDGGVTITDSHGDPGEGCIPWAQSHASAHSTPPPHT